MSDTEQNNDGTSTESETQEVEQSTEQEQNPESTEQEQKPEESKEDDKGKELPEWARNELSRTRDEAAKYRVRAKEAEDKLSKAKTVEEYEEAVAEFKAENAKLTHALLVRDVAAKYDLPTELAARLQGSTEEELEADAKLLAKFATQEDPEDLRGGLNPSETDGSFDPVATARAARKNRY